MTRRETFGAGSRPVSVLTDVLLLAACLAPAAVTAGLYVYFFWAAW